MSIKISAQSLLYMSPNDESIKLKLNKRQTDIQSHTLQSILKKFEMKSPGISHDPLSNNQKDSKNSESHTKEINNGFFNTNLSKKPENHDNSSTHEDNYTNSETNYSSSIIKINEKSKKKEEFKEEIERRFEKSICNKFYVFPRRKLSKPSEDINNESVNAEISEESNSSLESIRNVILYDLSSQNKKILLKAQKLFEETKLRQNDSDVKEKVSPKKTTNTKGPSTKLVDLNKGFFSDNVKKVLEKRILEQKNSKTESKGHKQKATSQIKQNNLDNLRDKGENILLESSLSNAKHQIEKESKISSQTGKANPNSGTFSKSSTEQNDFHQCQTIKINNFLTENVSKEAVSVNKIKANEQLGKKKEQNIARTTTPVDEKSLSYSTSPKLATKPKTLTKDILKTFADPVKVNQTNKGKMKFRVNQTGGKATKSSVEKVSMSDFNQRLSKTLLKDLNSDRIKKNNMTNFTNRVESSKTSSSMSSKKETSLSKNSSKNSSSSYLKHETDFLAANEIIGKFSEQNFFSDKAGGFTAKNKRNTHSGAIKNIEIKLDTEEKSESGNVTNRSGASVTLYQKMQDNLILQKKNGSIAKAVQPGNPCSANSVESQANKKASNIFNLSKTALNKFRYPQNIVEKACGSGPAVQPQKPTTNSSKTNNKQKNRTPESKIDINYSEERLVHKKSKDLHANQMDASKPQNSEAVEKTHENMKNSCGALKMGKSIDLNIEKVKDSTSSLSSLKRISYDSFTANNFSSLSFKAGIEKKN